MLDSLPVTIAVGTVFGFLSGLGVGGGSLLMLWLTLVLELDYSVARTINLLFFLPTAGIASVFRWKQGVLDFQKILPATLVGCITAAIFTLVSGSANLTLVKKLYGVLLMITGLRELFYRPRNDR